MDHLDETYWNKRYINNDIGWDLGEVSKPLKMYIDQIEDKSLRILIPGGGQSYEAEYLFKNGFKNVYVVDVSRTALDTILTRIPEFPQDQLIHDNFFNITGTFDLIFEQTFFCALHPSLRVEYVSKMHSLLSNRGRLVGVLFNIPLYEDHPPFGGHKKEYIIYFDSCFSIDIMEPCYNSVSDRQGKELFIKLIKN